MGRLNKKLKDNLRSEIAILEKLRHPHIVALHQCLESSTHINLVMEYCELGDLSLFIKKRDKLLSNPATRDLARKYPVCPGAGLHEVVSRHFLQQLASSIQFLRSKNLVHRDVKPQNLLLLASRSYRESSQMRPILAASDDSLNPVVGLASMPMLKLADFGFARVLPNTTLAETLCGSPLYMAPEILRYEKYDAKADLWSVGTVLYEMISGRPPFRANNHVELLRKIEAAEDAIRFPRDVVASSEMKALVRGLLKRNPVERMSFEDFFSNIVVTGPIPGLVEDDLPKPEQRRCIKEPVSLPSRKNTPEPSDHRRRLSITRRYQTPDNAQAVGVGSSPKERRPSPLSSPAQPRPPSQLSKRPSREGYEGLGIRPLSRASTRPSTHRPSNGSANVGTGKEARGRPPGSAATEEAMLDREYVLIDKNQVEVNAIADQLAAAGRTARSPKSTNVVRRSTGPARISTQHVVAGQRAGPLDKGIAGSPTSIITKAIHDASLRFFGFRNPQPFLSARTGTSPSQLYSPFPAYPASSNAAGLIGDGKANTPADEDNRVAQRIEENATLSDVVYGFAEVKYRQLVPLAPSMDHGLGGVPAEQMTGDDDGLTTEAIVILSEEALVLYLKSLSLLAKAIDMAGLWWTRKTRHESNSASQPALNSQDVTRRINSAVQWIRSRFNEVLEKAELAKMKLQEAQKQLPTDHPSHPSNHSPEPGSASGSGVDVFLTPGISAEKLMYERAVEMSRSAAINEVTNVDLDGCELSYITAIRMLEAVLDTEENMSQRRSLGTQRDEKGALQSEETCEIDAEDQQSVRKGNPPFVL